MKWAREGINEYTDDDILTLFSALISFVGAFILFLSFFFSKKWRSQQAEAKTTLFIMNVFDGIAAANYFVINDKVDIYCRLQSSSIQFFEIGGWMYECFVAIEMLILVSEIVKEKVKVKVRKNAFILRSVCYLSLTFGFGITTVTISNVNDDWTLLGKWCWIADPMNRLYYGYICLWISILITIICDINVIYILRDVISKRFQQRDSSLTSSPDSTDTRLSLEIQCSDATEFSTPKKVDKKTRSFYRRMFFGPLIFIIIHIPGSVRRCYQAAGKVSDVEATLVSLQSFCDPFHGFINFILYVVLDPELRSEWSLWILSLCREVSGYVTDVSNRKNSSTMHDSSSKNIDIENGDNYNDAQNDPNEKTDDVSTQNPITTSISTIRGSGNLEIVNE